MPDQQTSITLAKDLGELQSAVQAVYGRSDAPSVFLTFEWLDAAARWRQLEDELLLLTVESGDRVLGVVPLQRALASAHGITYRELQFLSVPDSQLCDIICAPHDMHTVVGAVVNFLGSEYRNWDLLRLNNIDRNSPTSDALAAAFAGHGLVARRSECGRNYGVSLRDDWSSYYARRSRRLKKGNNLIANRLKKNFTTVEVLHQDGELNRPSELDDLIDTAERVSKHSWKFDTGLTLDNPGPSRFIRALSAHAAHRRWLSLWQLRLDGETVAFEYHLVHKGCVYALRADYRRDYEDASPGTYLNWQILQQLFAQPLVHYYMGPGNNAYKERWSESADPLFEMRVYASTARGKLLNLLHEHARPLAKRLLRRPAGEPADAECVR